MALHSILAAERAMHMIEREEPRLKGKLEVRETK